MPTSHAIGQMTSSRGKPQLSRSVSASGMTTASRICPVAARRHPQHRNGYVRTSTMDRSHTK